jgi:hypothetical protein
MARNTVQHHSGFIFNYTDLNANVFPPKDGCVTSTIGWADLDGDGCIDFACIGTASGDYADTDHEAVAIHVPTGQAMWRVLRGEASKRLSMIGGVVVVSTNTGSRLRGLDPRSGGQIWNLGLEDALQEDPYDGDNRAPAISPVGAHHAAFECVDDTFAVVDVRNGQVVKRGSGKLHPLSWNLPNVIAYQDDSDNLELWDVVHNRSVWKLEESSQVRVLHSSGYYALMYRSEGAPRGYDSNYATKVMIFDGNGQNVGTSWVRNAEGDSVDHGDSQYGVVGGMILGGMKTVWSDPYSENAALVATLAMTGQTQAQPLPPPRPGYQCKAMNWCAPVLVTAWQKSKGTERLIVAGHDPNTLATLWVAEDLGGRSMENVLHVTGHAVLVPRSNDNYFSPTNPACVDHLDPATGAKVTEYPVENADCIGVTAHFLCGAPDYFSGGVPTAYDTWRRERVL